MLLSVIVPAFNCEKTIVRAIESTGVYFNNQVEVIVVNNGSQDKTKELVKKEAKKSKNIIYVESENGVSRARNEGIKRASAKWITFLDADDQLLNLDDRIMNILISAEEELLIGNYLVNKSRINLYSITKNKNDRISVINQMLENPTKYMTVWGKFYRTSIIQNKNLRFNDALTYSEDSEFLIRYTLLCNQMRFIKNDIYNYILSRNSTVRKYNPQMINEYENAILQIKEDLREHQEFKRAFKIFTLMQFNLIMVHNIFATDSSWIKLKEFCNKDYMVNSLKVINLKNIFTPRFIPLVLCKYHFYSCAAIIYKLRVIQNNKKIK